MIEIIPNWHPIFVHFTVGLLAAAVLLSVVAQFLSAGKLREQCQVVALWNLWLGAGITVLTVIAGVLAYNSVSHDTLSHEAMTEHRNWALVTAAYFFAVAIWAWLSAKKDLGINKALIIALLAGGGLLASTAWHGGEVVYRYGLGVMSLPKADTHEHVGGEAHEHDRPVENAQDKSDGHHDQPVHDNSDGHHHDTPH